MDYQPILKEYRRDPMRRALFVLFLMVSVGIGAPQAVVVASDRFTMIDVPGSSFTEAHEINERGEIVGNYTDANGLHGFLLSEGTFTTIDGPACPGPSQGPQTVAYGINNRGQVVGVSNPCGSESHGFLWEKGTLTTIDILSLPAPSPRPMG
jgi:probable HAF family extracellular repeat protein